MLVEQQRDVVRAIDGLGLTVTIEGHDVDTGRVDAMKLSGDVTRLSTARKELGVLTESFCRLPAELASSSTFSDESGTHAFHVFDPYNRVARQLVAEALAEVA